MSDPRILIVDDLDEQRALLRELLAGHGQFCVGEACDGRQGVETALAEPPALPQLGLYWLLLNSTAGSAGK